jgi:hypothetical protein
MASGEEGQMHTFATQGRAPAIGYMRYLALLGVVITVTAITVLLLWASAGDIASPPARHQTPQPQAVTQADAAGTPWWQSPPQPTPPGGNPYIGIQH